MVDTIFRVVLLKILLSHTLAHLVSSSLGKDDDRCVVVEVSIVLRCFTLYVYDATHSQFSRGSNATLFTIFTLFTSCSTRVKLVNGVISFSTSLLTNSVAIGVIYPFILPYDFYPVEIVHCYFYFSATMMLSKEL